MTDPHRPLKDAFGRFATGVSLVGCVGADGSPVMITVNSFVSVSLSPPLVLWCLERKASSFPAFIGADAYAVTVLHAGQRTQSERFARYRAAPLKPEEYERWTTGAPILKDRLAAFDCRIVNRHQAGDHVILVAEVVKFEARAGKPLLYFASRYSDGPETDR
ncbi:MAG: flavin reductase [Alphaproteobacteria bacterium]|nr:flavin reductase [Alphaproteobacteria bacterium]